MILVADESIDRQIVDRLRRAGHDVFYVADFSPATGDEVVLETANTRGALLLTADKDFGELVYRQRRIHRGVLLIRLAGSAPAVKGELVFEALRDHGPEMISHFAVLSPGLLRIRRSS